MVWGQPILPGEKKPADPAKLVRDLGFDSVTSYVWIHHVPLPKLQTDYNEVRDDYFAYWDKAEKMFDVPYYPERDDGLGLQPARATRATSSATSAIRSRTPSAATRPSASARRWS